MKALSFAKRNCIEILRDPINLGFGLGFPIVLIFLLSAIQRNIPVGLFEIENLAPGICIFGLSFITLFSATLISKDRSTSFLQRLYTTPLEARDFIIGYTLPMIPISIAQCIICYICAVILGLEININILYAILFIIPPSLLFISLGLLCGSIFNDKQVGGICGALLTNLTAWLSGTWFDLDLIGGIYKKIAYMLPFVHAVNLEKSVLSGNISAILPDLLWVLSYALIAFIFAVFFFLRQMKNN